MADTEFLPKKDNHGVRAYTPDPSQYHMPDAVQLSKGIRGTVIPRATPHVGSQGFTTAPGIVNIVDVGGDTPVTIAAVDMQKIRSGDVSRALADASGDLGEALTIIGHNQGTQIMAPIKLAEVKAVRTNPLRPGDYVVPASRAGGAQLNSSDEPVVASMSVPMSPSVRPRKPGKNMTVAKTPPPAQVARRAIEQPAVAVNTDEVFLVREDYVQRPAKPQVDLSALFASFNIECIAPEVQPPNHSVIFHGKFGTLGASYHDVCVHNQALVLIYDNRFKYGSAYIPPVADYEIEVVIDDVPHNVMSVGYQFNWGCFTIVCLIRREEVVEISNVPIAQDLVDAGIYSQPDYMHPPEEDAEDDSGNFDPRF